MILTSAIKNAANHIRQILTGLAAHGDAHTAVAGFLDLHFKGLNS